MNETSTPSTEWQRRLKKRRWWDRPNVTGDATEPWWTRAAVTSIDILLQPSFVGFEFGSGRSTLWIARRIKHLISIEHSPAWSELVRNDLRLQQVDNVDHQLVPREHYIDFIDQYQKFDTIFVDGEFRVPTFKKALSHIKPKQGIVVLDNSDMPLQKQAVDQAMKAHPKWECIRAWNGKWETAILITK